MSKLILGTVQMGLSYGINNVQGKMKFEEAASILKAAFNNGIIALDTAEAYGNAHQVIGDFHKQNPDISFNIITKFPHAISGDLLKRIDLYLKELYVEKLEGILFHTFQSYQDNKEYLKSLKELKRINKINLIGVSVYTNNEFKVVSEDQDIDLIQIPYNLFDNYSKRGTLIENAKIKGKIIHTRSCFLQGLFFSNIESPSKIVRSLKAELKRIQDISSASACSISALSLSYCILNKNIDNVLIGVDNMSQLLANLKDATVEIDEEVIKLINQIDVKNVKLLNPSLWNTL